MAGKYSIIDCFYSVSSKLLDETQDQGLAAFIVYLYCVSVYLYYISEAAKDFQH